MKKHRFLRIIDKLIMTAIIGGAIGSVLGMTLAPKPGKVTRALLKESWHRRRGIVRGILRRLFRREEEAMTKLPDESETFIEETK